MKFIFQLNNADDIVKINVRAGATLCDLGQRRHNNTIFLLARQKARDFSEGKPTAQQGWLYKDWLAEQLCQGNSDTSGVDFALINQHFSRFKRSLKQSIPSSKVDNIFEHRLSDNEPQVRFAPEAITIIEDGKTLVVIEPNSCDLTSTEPLKNDSNQLVQPSAIIALAVVTLIIMIAMLLTPLTEESYFNQSSGKFVLLEPDFAREFGLDKKVQYQIRANIERAVFDYASSQDNIEFVDIVFEQNPDILSIGQIYEADFVLHAEVNCSVRKACEFTFKKYHIDKHAEVQSAFNLPLQLNAQSKVYWGLYFGLDSIFQQPNNQSIAPPQGVDSDSIEKFINAYALWRDGRINDDVLKTAFELQQRFSHWQFARDTYGTMLITMHEFTSDPIYLHKLKGHVDAKALSDSKKNLPTHYSSRHIFCVPKAKLTKQWQSMKYYSTSALPE